jgi:oligopeptide transport system ATP-binding protein
MRSTPGCAIDQNEDPLEEIILEVKDLAFSFSTYAGEVQAVRGVSFYLRKGETLAIVGESGCGKSVSAQSIMKLNPMPPGRLKSGSIRYKGAEISTYSEKQMEALRGSEFSMIFQDPMTSLNPTMRVGDQITEGIRKHQMLSRKVSADHALEMLRLVGIPNPERNMLRYPHTFSGGMRQRIMIAMALACKPGILFADEPTTALDVTTQAQIIELMNDLKQKLGTAIVLITHDLGVVARMAERIAVMYAGEIVETGSADDLFYRPQHPYTWGLLGSIPGAAGRHGDLLSIPGTPPDLFAPPSGCAFAARCMYRMKVCESVAPPKIEIASGHLASCWRLDPRAPKVSPPVLIRQRNTNPDLQDQRDLSYGS